MAFSPTAYTVLGISLTTISFRLFLATVTACFGVLRLALPRTLCWQYGRLRYVFDFSLQSLHTPANPIPNPQCMTFRSAGVYLAGHIAGRDTFPTLARGRYPFLRCMVFNSATYTVLAKSLAAIRFRLFLAAVPPVSVYGVYSCRLHFGCNIVGRGTLSTFARSYHPLPWCMAFSSAAFTVLAISLAAIRVGHFLVVDTPCLLRLMRYSG